MKTEHIIVIVLIIVTISIMVYRIISKSKQSPKPVLLAADDKSYQNLGIKKGQPADWEDGLRTDGGPGSYEWWYVDILLRDGTTGVILFYTKDGFDVPGPAQPTVTVHLTFPDGKVVSGRFSEKAGTTINATKDKCDVQIGNSYIRQIGDAYELRVAIDEIDLEATMKSTIPMWRPETGHWYFGEKQDHLFAWFVAQPASVIHGKLRVAGTDKEIIGNAYHDHNWGNMDVNKVMNHWYWAHAKAGDYDIISADIISDGAYGYTRIPIIMIAKNGEVIEDNQRKLFIERSNSSLHPITGKFMDNHITFKLTNLSEIVYIVEYFREKDIVVTKFVENLPIWKKILAKAIGANPTYIRNLGDVTLTIRDGENLSSFQNKAIWAQMSFGNEKVAPIGKLLDEKSILETP